MAAACAGTASMNPLLAGIRRHRPKWAPVLREIERRLLREAKQIGRNDLGSVEQDRATGLSPTGFLYTEAWAVMLDGLATPNADDESSDEPQREQQREESETERKEAEPPVTKEQVKKARSATATGQWPEVRIGRLPLVVPAPGGLGRKRCAADRGRAPRRIHRLLTDPQRRVFDQKRRGNGGVVLVDGSGSMSLSEQDARDILKAAPGATIAIYACTTGDEPENLWVLADNGKMADQIPERTYGNGVDLPALLWAAKQRQHANAPLMWITDGLVHQANCGWSDRAALECIQATITNGALVRPNVESAIVALRDMASGRKPQRWYPFRWRTTWQRMRGVALPSVTLPTAEMETMR
jgi:hypothetical protein